MPKGNPAFMQPKNVSPELAEIVGPGPMPRTEVTSKIWEYIKKHNLQDAKDRRTINPDEKLKKVLGNDPINMMKMAGALSKHIS